MSAVPEVVQTVKEEKDMPEEVGANEVDEKGSYEGCPNTSVAASQERQQNDLDQHSRATYSNVGAQIPAITVSSRVFVPAHTQTRSVFNGSRSANHLANMEESRLEYMTFDDDLVRRFTSPKAHFAQASGMRSTLGMDRHYYGYGRESV
ncbi:hypothetical protein CPC08DRAFT_770858 [Agrocybe pediades]|nr:hypothetical protein CPC08DRAFT_770858 [Agrocybe pediades]